MSSNEETLAGLTAFGMGMFRELAARAEPILKAKVEASGVAHFKDLGLAVASSMLKESLTEAAASHFTEIDMPSFRRAVDAFFDPEWAASFGRVQRMLEEARPAFDLAVGPDVAVVMAGVGVPVAPLDKKTMRPLGSPTRDWREAARVFGRLKTAFVGYDTTSAPFYALVTDSLNTLNAALRADGRLADALVAVRRTPYEFKDAPIPFQHSTLLVPREESDRFETLMLEDPRPSHGSILFLAGWKQEAEAFGAPNEGMMGMPLQVVHAILQNPAFFAWVNPVTGKSPNIH